MKRFYDGIEPGGEVCPPAGTTLVKWSNAEGFYLCLDEVDVCTIAAAKMAYNSGRISDKEYEALNVAN